MITLDISSEIPWLNPAVMIAGLRRWIRKGIIVLEGASKKETPVNTGTLRNSYRSRFEGIEGELVNTAKYAYWVHEGRKAWIAPPSEPIAYWAKRKGINAPIFLLTRSIAKKWTKAQPFFTRAVEAEEENVISLIKSEISKNLW